MSTRLKLFLVALIILVVVAHVGLWRDPEIPVDVKRRLTTLNALGWAGIILPVFAVHQWLKVKTRPTTPPKE